MVEIEQVSVAGSLDTVSSKYCDSQEDNGNEQKKNQRKNNKITDEVVEVAIIDKEQHQVTIDIDTYRHWY